MTAAVPLELEPLKRRLAALGSDVLAAALRLDEGARRQPGGLLLRCPAHQDRTPSCSLRVGPDGLLQVKCFACDLAGDVFTLIAAALGLDLRGDFPRVLEEAAALAGAVPTSPARRPRPVPRPAAPSYPPEAAELWQRCRRVWGTEAARYLREQRAIDPAACEDADLCRVLPLDGPLPLWCASWRRTGHHLVLPAFDAWGALRALRGRLLRPPALGQAKELGLRGFTSRGLVFACPLARRLLAQGDAPTWTGELLLVEGGPDFLSVATVYSDAADEVPAVLGYYSGSWIPEIAARVPPASTVRLLAHDDEAGQRMAGLITASLPTQRILLAERFR